MSKGYFAVFVVLFGAIVLLYGFWQQGGAQQAAVERPEAPLAYGALETGEMVAATYADEETVVRRFTQESQDRVFLRERGAIVTAALSATGRHMAYVVRSRDGGDVMKVYDFVSGERTSLLAASNTIKAFALSETGDGLLYTESASNLSGEKDALFVISLAAEEQRLLYAGAFDPVWSGEHTILFLEEVDGATLIRFIDTKTQEVVATQEFDGVAAKPLFDKERRDVYFLGRLESGVGVFRWHDGEGAVAHIGSIAGLELDHVLSVSLAPDATSLLVETTGGQTWLFSLDTGMVRASIAGEMPRWRGDAATFVYSDQEGVVQSATVSLPTAPTPTAMANVFFLASPRQVQQTYPLVTAARLFAGGGGGKVQRAEGAYVHSLRVDANGDGERELVLVTAGVTLDDLVLSIKNEKGETVFQTLATGEFVDLNAKKRDEEDPVASLYLALLDKDPVIIGWNGTAYVVY